MGSVRGRFARAMASSVSVGEKLGQRLAHGVFVPRLLPSIGKKPDAFARFAGSLKTS